MGSCLMSRFDTPAPIPDCHREWWELCTSPARYVAIAAPRGHAKSTAITHSYILASVLFRERSFVLIISGTEAQSINFLNDIKQEIAENEDLKRLFGNMTFVKEAETDIIVKMQDGHRFRIMAKGSEQKLRGVKWDAKRPDLVVCDDIEEDEQVMSKDRREKFRRWFYGALLPALAPGGVIRMVGTILHMDSLLERLMPEYQLAVKMKRKLLQETALKVWTDHPTSWRSAKYRAHSPDFDEVLWSDMWPADRLIEKRDDYRAQGLPDVYAQEYLNVPLDESTAYFRKKDFQDTLPIDKHKVLNYYITTDLAIGEKDRSDYTVFLVAGMDENGILYVKNVVRARMDAREIIENVFTLETMYKPVAFGIEEGQIQKSLGPFLYEEMHKRNTYPNILLLKPSIDKIERARSISARMRASGVKFEKMADWFPTLEDEMMRFPRDKHDDQVDCMAYLGLMLNKLIEAPTKAEAEEEEYNAEYRQSGLWESGRSNWTGY